MEGGTITLMWRAARAAVSVAVAFAVLVASAGQAGAWQELAGVGWWLKASGSVHCTDGSPEGPNHVVCRGHAAYSGADQGVFDELWYPTDFCQIGQITSGDNAGTPFRLRLVSPPGSGRGCVPWAYSGTVAFYDGHGTWAGYHAWNTSQVSVYEICAPVRPCGTVEARATMIEIY